MKIFLTWSPTFLLNKDDDEKRFAVCVKQKTIKTINPLDASDLEEYMTSLHPNAKVCYIQEITPIDWGIKTIRYWVDVE